jgi:hypothetical protein
MTLSLGVVLHINIYEIATFIWFEIWNNQLHQILLLILTVYPRIISFVMSVRPSVPPRDTTRLPLHGFS